MSQQAPGWKDIPIGGVIGQGGTAQQYETGGWRNVRPIHSKEKCINCLICWLYCPDAAVIVENGKVLGMDLDHCKGCGICAKECPSKVHAIEMLDEDTV